MTMTVDGDDDHKLLLGILAEHMSCHKLQGKL